MTKMNADVDYLRLLMVEKYPSNVKRFKNCVNVVAEQQLVQSAETNVVQRDIIPLVNASINAVGEKRTSGLSLLRRILSQCSSDIFCENAQSWMQQCCKGPSETAGEELEILRILIENSTAFPEVKKYVISSLLPRFVDQLMNHRCDKNPKVAKLKLRCLKSITDHYISACGSHRNEFHKYIFYCLKQFPEDKKVIQEAARCFVCLCGCSSKGQRIGQKELWAGQLKALIDTCHKLFDSVYSCVDFAGIRPDVQTETTIPALLEMCEETPDDPISRFDQWNVTFVVWSELLQYMFMCKFPVCKSFKPNDIFTLICRLLAVNGNTLANCSQTNDVRCLSAILPNIHGSTLDILFTLIRTVKRNLIPYGTLICKLCLQSLKWTQSTTWKYGTIRPFESLRCKVYCTLSAWLSVAGSSSSVEMFADELISSAISNIEFLKPEMQLTATNQRSKRKRKKAERNSHQIVDTFSVIDRTANRKLCLAALRMLQSLIRNTHCLIKWEHHKTLQYAVIPLLLQIVRSNCTASYPLPYSSGKCRLELYATLYALTKWPHWKWRTPVSLSGRIFDAGRNDDDFKVSCYCSSALAELDVIIHPRGPTLTASVFDDESASNVRRPKSAPAIAFSVTSPKVTATVAVESIAPVVDEERRWRAATPETSAAASVSSVSTVRPNEPVVVDTSPLGRVSATAVDIDATAEPIESPCPNLSVAAPGNGVLPRPLVEENSTSRKKPKIDNLVAVQIENDSIVASMLNDFVDTLR